MVTVKILVASTENQSRGGVIRFVIIYHSSLSSFIYTLQIQLSTSARHE